MARKMTRETLRPDYRTLTTWTDAEAADFMHLSRATITKKRSLGELPLAADFPPCCIDGVKLMQAAHARKAAAHV